MRAVGEMVMGRLWIGGIKKIVKRGISIGSAMRMCVKRLWLENGGVVVRMRERVST